MKRQIEIEKSISGIYMILVNMLEEPQEELEIISYLEKIISMLESMQER